MNCNTQDIDLTLTEKEANEILAFLDDWVLAEQNESDSDVNMEDNLSEHNKEVSLNELQIIYISTYWEMQNYLKFKIMF